MARKPSARARARALHDFNTRKNDIQNITDALILSGHTSLDEQARALGLRRSTAWTIVKNKHKAGRLSAKTVERIIANPGTPHRVRVAVLRYAERWG